MSTEIVERERVATQHGEVSPGKEYDKWLLQLKIYCSERGRQAALAKELVVTTQTITYWLGGKRRPSLKNFLAVARIMRRRRKK